MMLELGCGLELLEGLPDGGADVIITDPPYAMTQAAWDQGVDWARFWREAERTCRGAVVVFAAQPFSSRLVVSAPDGAFGYAMVWVKSRASGHLNSSWQPLGKHEDVLVFWPRRGVFNPQRERVRDVDRVRVSPRSGRGSTLYGRQAPSLRVEDGTRHPTTVLTYASAKRGIHPARKPVELLRYLVRTYSNPGALVVDPFAGSGVTGEAALSEGRRFLGAELEPEFHRVALERLQAAASKTE